jgi:hypothetical protein
MPTQRQTEVNVLGYRIECVQELDGSGVATRHYEVLAPESLALLGTFPHRAEAERDIIIRELRALRRDVAA